MKKKCHPLRPFPVRAENVEITWLECGVFLTGTLREYGVALISE